MSEQTSARWLTPPKSNSSFRHSMGPPSGPRSRRYNLAAGTISKSKLSFSFAPEDSTVAEQRPGGQQIGVAGDRGHQGGHRAAVAGGGTGRRGRSSVPGHLSPAR